LHDDGILAGHLAAGGDCYGQPEKTGKNEIAFFGWRLAKKQRGQKAALLRIGYGAVAQGAV